MAIPRTQAEVLKTFFQSYIQELHHACPGIVQSYNAATQTADIQPAISKPLQAADGSTVYDKIPVIPNVKILFPKSQAMGMHWDLQKGDGVMIFFSNYSMSEYIENGEASEPFDVQISGLGGAVAFPCSLPDASNFSTLKDGNRVGIDGDDAQVDFSPGKVKIVPSATLAAARKTDPVKVTVDATIMGEIAANLVCASPGSPPSVAVSPTTFDITGSITDGSGKVNIG